MSEEQALQAADRHLRRRANDDGRIREESTPKVIEPFGFFREGLLLLEAAPLIGFPRQTGDPCHKAVMGLTEVQIDLLWSGWCLLLSGHYASAAHMSRSISELCNYIPAASKSPEGTKKLLNGQEWRVSDARKVVLREFPLTDPTQGFAWTEDQKRKQNAFAKLAHPGKGLIMAASHFEQATTQSIGHAFNEQSLLALANQFASFAVSACLSIGLALNDSLPDSGAWSVRQADLLKRWTEYEARVAPDST
jgi:hypothetical protein